MKKEIKNINVLISTLFGVGYFPKAPGTAGTAVAAIVYYFLPIADNMLSWLLFLSYILIMSLLSVFFITKAENILGHDNGKIVIDEFLGYMIAVLFLPKTIWIIIGAFILFRFFDIIKPEPVNMLQKLPKGWGVMVDDLMAGVYANLVLQIIVRLIL
ncbi:MAG: phosphatidylglycerophosphatase A [Candidatus Cloacimonetes bacterium]|nr:phosphatidylglycerophosphatase A [Candidatus Cloacimonadota bacterium]